MTSHDAAQDAFVAIAMRTAIRALPTLRFQLESGSKEFADTLHPMLIAIHVCAWSGSVVFAEGASAENAESLRWAIDLTRQWVGPARPELISAELAIERLPDRKDGSDSPPRGQKRREPSAADRIKEAVATLEHDPLANALASALAADLAFPENAHDLSAEVFRSRPLWASSAPEDWLDAEREWEKGLERYGDRSVARWHREMVKQLVDGSLDWSLPQAFIAEWPARERAVLKPAVLSAPGAAEDQPVPLDLTKYTFSGWGARSILASAIERLTRRDGDALSSSVVLLEMAEAGQPVSDPQWIGDFLRRAVSSHPQTYAEVLKKWRISSSRERRSAPPDELPPRVVVRPGLAWVIYRAQEIALATSGSNQICGRHLFAALIVDPPAPHTLGSKRVLEEIGFNVPLLRQRLYEWVRGYSEDDAAWQRQLTEGNTPRRRIAFDADSITGPDFLNIEPDVVALATLIAARDSTPPLSIGLFGDWGSGKTFFMQQLRHSVADLSAEARASGIMQCDYPFYKRIVQIEFNAWHYAEGNLWASMVEHILANLRISDNQGSTATQKLQEHLIKRLDFAEAAATDADRKRNDAAAKVKNAEDAVVAAQDEHEAKKAELQRLSSQSAARAFNLSGAVPVITQALDALGLKRPLTDAVLDLQSSLRDARAVVERGTALGTSLVRAKDRWTRALWLAVILFGAPLTAWAVGWLVRQVGPDWIARAGTFATGLAGLLGGVAAWLRKQTQWLDQQREMVARAQRAYDDALNTALAENAAKIAALEQEASKARQDYVVAQQRADQARREQEAARTELAAATTSSLLGRFIQDRAASTDYRQHLGLLALVRQDFQQLSQLIEEDNWQLAPPRPNEGTVTRRGLRKFATLDDEERGAETRINRIVLYIDDLDRCKPEKVVEVLQAVHLLLAFPLFVVVVGVDARWVSRSLETRYRELLHVGDDAAVDIAEMFGVARSEDYLEKIFQVPLWLRRMDANAARRMVQGMLRAPRTTTGERPAVPPDTTPNTQAASPATGSTAPQSAQVGTPATSTAETHESKSPAMPDAAADHVEPREDPKAKQPMTSGEASATDSETSKRTPNLESLTIHDFELAVIDDLSPLLGRSPRALKRFVNVYRLVKAGLTPAEHVVFIQQVDDQLDEYAAVLFLLAVDTGLPRAAVALFDRLDGTDPSTEGDLVTFIDSLHDHPAAKTGDYVKLQEWAKGPKRRWWYAKNAVGRLAAWSGRVARHSFQVAHADKTPPAKQDNPRAHGHPSRG